MRIDLDWSGLRWLFISLGYSTASTVLRQSGLNSIIYIGGFFVCLFLLLLLFYFSVNLFFYCCYCDGDWGFLCIYMHVYVCVRACMYVLCFCCAFVFCVFFLVVFWGFLGCYGFKKKKKKKNSISPGCCFAYRVQTECVFCTQSQWWSLVELLFHV